MNPLGLSGALVPKIGPLRSIHMSFVIPSGIARGGHDGTLSPCHPTSQPATHTRTCVCSSRVWLREMHVQVQEPVQVESAPEISQCYHALTGETSLMQDIEGVCTFCMVRCVAPSVA